MGLITAIAIGSAMSAAATFGINKAMGHSTKQSLLGPMAFLTDTKHEKRRKIDARIAEQQSGAIGARHGSSLSGSDKARLLMTKGGQQGQDLQGGDFSTKRNIFGN
jgi:hypothetical protein